LSSFFTTIVLFTPTTTVTWEGTKIGLEKPLDSDGLAPAPSGITMVVTPAAFDSDEDDIVVLLSAEEEEPLVFGGCELVAELVMELE
jgi:hypothetical protein